MDFDENSGPDMIRFDPGETMKCFNVSITDDNVTETDEDFEIEIVVVRDGPSGSGTSPQVGPVTVTIVDDDGEWRGVWHVGVTINALHSLYSMYLCLYRDRSQLSPTYLQCLRGSWQINSHSDLQWNVSCGL